MNKKNQELFFRSVSENHFRFKCHKDIECFTRCCRDLNLILTPYDIIRLKARLNMASDTFLEDYTETRLSERNRFPLVYLKMKDEGDKACPFVSSEGCILYEDRPGACRIYPIGRAATKPDGKRHTTERFFIVEEEHCLGFKEEKEWVLDEWLSSEGVDKYNAMNDPWMEIITSSNSLGDEQHVQKKIQMFYMASYNLDRFREFLFQSAFFERFVIEPTEKEALATDDIKLMMFAVKWLKFSLFGEKTIQIKEGHSFLINDSKKIAPSR